MTDKRKSIHGEWSNRWMFILAATGSAVGLGSIWKFPYITGENGGGAFVVVYLICIAIIGIPVMMAEIMIGRRGRKNPVQTMTILANEENRPKIWSLLGWVGVIVGFLILSYYSVIAGWALAYVMKAGAATFTGLPAEEIKAIFSALVADPRELIFWHTLFMAMTVVVVARGVRRGLETAVQILMPLLVVLLIVLLGYALSTGAFARGVSFMFAPDFSKITKEGVLIAMGHAFFTLSLGMGAIMIYGAYMPEKASIARASIAIAGADTVVSLLAGLIIFPIVFANNLQPNAGPGLVFQTLPIAFGQMPGGVIFGTLFFILLVFAAWASAISIIEPVTSWLVESRNWSRLKASVISGLAAWILGLGTVFSFNIGSDITFRGKTFFVLLDFLAANVMLPLSGLFIALFAVWAVRRASSEEELAMSRGGYTLWRFVTRYLTPVAIIIVFLNLIGIF